MKYSSRPWNQSCVMCECVLGWGWGGGEGPPAMQWQGDLVPADPAKSGATDLPVTVWVLFLG